MRFILTTGALTRFESLDHEYKSQMRKSTYSNIMPSALGGNDPSRTPQIVFLEKIYALVKHNLFKEGLTPEELEAKLTASRVMLAAIRYVQSQIKKPKTNSVLYNLLNEHAGITKQNSLDKEDEEVSFFAATQFFETSRPKFDSIDWPLYRQWEDFQTFLKKKCDEAKTPNPYANLPITSMTQPLFGHLGAYVGASLGYTSGEVISKSSNAMQAHYKLTAFIGSTCIVFGSVSPASVALVAPIAASKLITTFCSFSLAHIMGVTMGLVGQGVGIGVGLPLDAAYILICKACRTLYDYCNKDDKQMPLTGLRIFDGASMIGGIPFTMTNEKELPKEYHTVEIKADGEIYLNNERLEEPKTLETLIEDNFDFGYDSEEEAQDSSISHEDSLTTEQTL